MQTVRDTGLDVSLRIHLPPLAFARVEREEQTTCEPMAVVRERAPVGKISGDHLTPSDSRTQVSIIAAAEAGLLSSR
eukprot:3087551-Rhodomonas_salina.1